MAGRRALAEVYQRRGCTDPMTALLKPLRARLQLGAVLLPMVSGVGLRSGEASVGLLDRGLCFFLRRQPARSRKGPRVHTWRARRHGPHPYAVRRTMIVQEHATDRSLP